MRNHWAFFILISMQTLFANNSIFVPYLKITKFNLPKQHIEDNIMAEAKGLSTPVKMKSELAALVGAASLPRTEITKKIWDYVKANKLQTKTVNGKPENAGKYIVCDAKLHPIFKNTKSTSKTGKLTDLTNIKEGETVDMMQMAAIVGANIA